MTYHLEVVTQETDPCLIRYGGGETDDYSSDTNSEYISDYESDTETSTIKSSTSSLSKVDEQDFNMTYHIREEKFDDNFTQRDLLNKIREIMSSPVVDMSNNSGSLQEIHLWDYLLPNSGSKNGISLLDAYERHELIDKLVIQIEQGEYRKFSVIDNISEVYELPGIHECINGQRPLRPVIDVDASSKDMEVEKVNGREVFIRICFSFIRALYKILDCSWHEILRELVITTSSDESKCSFHILYAPALLIDYQELKEFTELVYTLTGEKYGKFIDRGLPGQNFYLRLIGSAKKKSCKAYSAIFAR